MTLTSDLEIGIPTIAGREHILLSCLVSVLNGVDTPVSIHICSTDPRLKVGHRDDPLFLNRFLRSMVVAGWDVRVSQDRVASGPRFAVQQLLDRCEKNWLLRIDDDVVVASGTISKLWETLKTVPLDCGKLGAVASPVNGFGADFVDYPQYWSEQKRTNSPHLIGLGRVEYGNDNFVHHSGNPEQPVWAEVDFLSGYCILMSVDAARAVGGYDGCPHHHKEDWSLTLKMRASGYRLMIRGDAVAWHHHHSKDASDEYRHGRSKQDHAIWEDLRRQYRLDPERHVGIVWPK